LRTCLWLYREARLANRSNIWIYREEGRLSRGSGLHINQEGRALDHHFLIPPDSPDFKFTDGDYTLKVYAKIVGIERSKLLQVVSVHLPDSVAREAVASGGARSSTGHPIWDSTTYTRGHRPLMLKIGHQVSLLRPGCWPKLTRHLPSDAGAS
jgi:hypothetical protein